MSIDIIIIIIFIIIIIMMMIMMMIKMMRIKMTTFVLKRSKSKEHDEKRGLSSFARERGPRAACHEFVTKGPQKETI